MNQSRQSDEEFFQVGGTLKEGAPSYIERPADSELLAALEKGELCLVLAPRQTGKSSLMVHAKGKLHEKGIRAGIVDLQPLGSQTQAEQWFTDVVYRIERNLELSNARRDPSTLAPTRSRSQLLAILASRGRLSRIVAGNDRKRVGWSTTWTGSWFR